MKALKILGGIIGVLVLGAAAFWFFMIRHPSPEAVCDHVVELMKKEAGDKATGPALDSIKTQCAKEMQAPEYGMLPYAKKMKCAMAADSLAELTECDSRR